jgi:uncharacterized protein YdaU (DUF1376 family)
MSGVPYIRFFGDDWLSGTQDLSLEERGALVTIVALTAATGQPPALDYQRLARRFGCTPGKAKKMISALEDLGKIAIEGEEIHNERAMAETAFSQKKSEKQSENASARWSKKTKKSNKNSEARNAAAVPRQCQPEPEPKNIEEPNGSLSELPSDATSQAQPVSDAAEAVAMYNTAAEHAGWPKVAKLTPARAKSLRARLKECGGLEGWQAALRRAYASDFCREGWRAFGFDSLISQQKFTRLMEGSYDNRNHDDPAAGRHHHARAGGHGSGTVEAFAAVAAEMQREQARG